MFKLPLRKLLFTVKLCFLVVLVLITLSLFEYWRGGKRATRAYVLDPDEELYERQILEDEARIIPGLGEGGRPAYLTGDDKRLGEEAEKKYAVNTYLSDRIAYNRTLKDFRNPACERVTYDAELPSTSVIIIFHNEPYSVVVRTIWSVLNTARRDQPWHRQANYLERGSGRIMKLGYPGQPEDSDFVYLKEIILVDDNSTLPELRGKLARYVRTRLPPDMVRILRLPDRIGLTRARLAGARSANGEVLIFLDAHCEGVTDWMRPLLQRIKDSPTAVVMPIIDVVEHKDFFYSVQDPTVFQVGGFTFVGHFTWIDVPEREKRRRGSDIAPTWSPTMAGGLFAIRRAYYWELGAYDEQMAGWGGENLEMSFRIWQCGGTLETIPCSRVGHVFRSFHPYGLPANSDTHGINTARMAEVWMDDYAELFYLHRPDLRKNPKIGDVTHRKILREKLHCKSFQWFLDNVYREKYVPVRDSTAFGRVQNLGTNLCLDTMQREGEASPLGFYPCHSKLTDTQYLSLSLAGQLRDEERCAEVQFVRRAQGSAEDDGESRLVVMVTCRENIAKMQWRYVAATGQLQHLGTGLCVDARGARAGDDARARPCARDDTPSQRWMFDYIGDETRSGVLPAELEQVLGKIRGQRRKSRSLLSVREEEAAPPRARAEAAGAAPPAPPAPPREPQSRARRHRERRRHRSKKKQKRESHQQYYLFQQSAHNVMSREVRKKIHKNKFIVTIERTLRNSSTEHLEMDIHCRHRRLFPNNSFVRDLVSILNDKDIRVINNGRVFEKNKVTDLDKDHLRQLEDKAQRTTEPPEREGEESKDASAEMTRAPPAATPRDEEVAPPRLTTEDPKPKKRHHKKKHSSPRAEKRPRGREPSLLLSDRDSYHVAIGSGANGTVAQLPTAGAASQRARETDDEWERGSEFFKTRSSMEHGGPANERDFVSSLRPYGSSELRVSEDRARGAERGGGDRTQGYKGGADRTRGDYREEVDGTNALRGDARNAVDSARDTRPLDRPRGGLADEDRSERARVREAIARHAEMYRGAEAGGRRGQAGPQVLSEAQGRPYEDRDAAANQPWVSHATDKDKTRYALDRDSSGRNTVHRDGSDRNTEDRDTSGRQTPVKAHHTDTIDARNFHPADFDEKRAWPRLISTDVDNPNSWDPWGPREPGAAERADTRKAAKGPHDAVAQLVYHDVWDRGAAPVRGHDRRVAELAKEVMMEYDDVTEKPPPAALPQPRAASRETGVAERESRGRALRVRLKSNMTFNLGDELLNWRRMKMTGQDSESGSPSDEADSHVEAD